MRAYGPYTNLETLRPGQKLKGMTETEKDICILRKCETEGGRVL